MIGLTASALALTASLTAPQLPPPTPLPPQVEQPPGLLAVTNAHLHPVTSAPIEGGTMLVEDGRIVAVGADVEVPEGARVLDVRGMTVMPGIVESHSHMGFKQLWRPETGTNNNELSQSANAEARAMDGLNTRDLAFRIALAGGVTTMNITPGSRSPNSGQAVVAKMRGQTVDEMFLAHGGMKFAIRVPGRSFTLDRTSEADVGRFLEERLREAVAYREAMEQCADGPARCPPEDLQNEAFGKLLSREWPVGVHAHSVDAMQEAIRLAELFDLRLYVHHGEATRHLVDELLAAEVPVSYGPVLPGTDRDHPDLAGPVELARRGGLVAFHQDHPDGPQYYLRDAAALFVRRGMPEDEALKALTLNPARIFGLDDRIGSLEPGKDADFLILSGPPLDVTSRVEKVFIEGVEVLDRHAPEPLYGGYGDGWTYTGPAEVRTSEPDADYRAASTFTDPPDAVPADLVIRGGEIHTVSHGVIREGTVVIRDGRIRAVGRDVELMDEDVPVIDTRGRAVTPGLIDARTTYGVPFQARVDRENLFGEPRELADVVSPEEDNRWLRQGVTAAYVSPGPWNLVMGWGSVVKLASPGDGSQRSPDGGTPVGSEGRAGELPVVSARAGVSVSFGPEALDAFDDAPDAPTTRQGMVARLRQELILVRDFVEVAGAAPGPGSREGLLAAMLQGDVPVRFVANTPDDIRTAVRVGREFGLRTVIDVGAGAHQVADALAEAGVPVVVGPSILAEGGGGPFEMFAHTAENAGRLHAAGVDVALSTDDDDGRSVTLEAVVARAHGLPAGPTLEAVTLGAARILGVDDRLGSLEAGKDADLVVWDGDPMSTWSEPVLVIVDGEVVYRRRVPEAGPTTGGSSRDADAEREGAGMRR